jgi:hypothetical protein
MVITTIRRIRRIKPAAFKVFAILGFIADPFIPSIKTKSNLPPSSAGKGNKFITAKLREINAVNWIR